MSLARSFVSPRQYFLFFSFKRPDLKPTVNPFPLSLYLFLCLYILLLLQELASVHRVLIYAIQVAYYSEILPFYIRLFFVLLICMYIDVQTNATQFLLLYMNRFK